MSWEFLNREHGRCWRGIASRKRYPSYPEGGVVCLDRDVLIAVKGILARCLQSRERYVQRFETGRWEDGLS
jgi:hypothetical protein